MRRILTRVPDVPQGAVWNPRRGYFSVVIPIERTNEITNPSAETNTTNYTTGAGTLTRSTEQQYHGAYSLKYVPSAATTDGFYYGTVSMTAGQTRAISCKWLGAAGVKYKLSVATTGGVDLVSYTFTATGRWQWIYLYWTETSTTTRRIYFTKNGSTSTAAFYIDGVQSEVIVAGETVSTYIDGDEAGLLVNQAPAPYRWNGVAHASTSTRLATTAAGGYVRNLDRYRFKALAFAGLGLMAVSNIATVGAGTDGAQYQTTVAQSRQLSINGFWDAETPGALDQVRAQLYTAVGPDHAAPRQPVTLIYQPFDGEDEIGAFGRIVASYQSGLEQNATPTPRENVAITFTQFLPGILAGDDGVVLDGQDSVANANAILRRSASGTWSALSTGLAGVGVTALAIAPHPNGLIYVGGVFTSAGATSADFAASYNPATDAWAVLGGSATTFNAQVNAIAIAPNGDVIFGGLFTNAAGIAAADGIVRYTPGSDTFNALGTGVNAGGVYSLAYDQSGYLYAGGSFTLMGGVANTIRIARWDGSVWTALGTGASSNIVRALLSDPGGNLYAGGDYGLMSGVAGTVGLARWDGTNWNAMGAGVAGGAVLAFVQMPDGLYIGGLYATIDGLAIPFLSRWNGTGFSAVGEASALSSYVQAFARTSDNRLYLGGDFLTVNGVTFPDRAAIWNGGSFGPLDVDLPSSATIFALALVPSSGDLYVGYNQTGTATAAGLATATNNGTMAAYPTVVIDGPSSGTARVYSIANNTSGDALHLNLTINAGETITLTATQYGARLVSSWSGDVTHTILNSSVPTLAIRPGVNTIAMLTSGSTVAAVMHWSEQYQSVSDLVSR